MPEVQLRLFPPSRPFRERFGQAFFRTVPARPGVYVMTGRPSVAAPDRILYVGKAKNLRTRLRTYTCVHPDRHSRRLVRLVHAVDAITWEVTGDEQEALLRENELLRLHRPRFNSANTHPESYWFLELMVRNDELILRRVTGKPDHCRVFGAFKSMSGFGALLRLLWFFLADGPALLPGRLFHPKLPRQHAFTLGRCSGIIEGLEAFLNGASDELRRRWVEEVAKRPRLTPFHQSWLASDLESLAQFYRTGPRHNWELRRKLGLEVSTIRPDQLDDFVVLGRD